MVFENIQIEHGNFTLDDTATNFFSLDHDNQQLVEKTPAGGTAFVYLLDEPILEVQSLQHDGYYFWSLEKQGLAGFRVRKWELRIDNILYKESEFSFITGFVDKFDVNAMAVEHYADSFDNGETSGTATFDVTDGSVIRIGDNLVLGPSTAVGFEGTFSFASIVNKVGDAITISPSLDRTFSPDDPITFSRSFFVFSDLAPAGLTGALYKYRSSDGFPLSLSTSNLFNKVRGTTFFQSKLLFVRGGEIIWLNPTSQNIFKSQAIDNLDEDRGEYHTAFDLTGASNTIYRLEQQHVFADGGGFSTEDWSPLFNYNTSGAVPAVYFVAVKAEPPIVHKSAAGVPAGELVSNITVTVLDQFRTPVASRVVDLVSDGGALSSVQETTDTNGQIQVTYTASSTAGEFSVTATVT